MYKKIASVIIYDQRSPIDDRKWEKMCQIFGGYPDKSISPFARNPIDFWCPFCRLHSQIPHADFVVNRFVVCRLCESGMSVPDNWFVAPDMGNVCRFNGWGTKLYNN